MGSVPSNICIVSPEILNWGEPNEVKGAVEGLAQSLAACGHNVTLLWVPGREPLDKKKAKKLQKYYFETFLIKLKFLTKSKDLLPVLWTNEQQSVALYHHLKRKEYDRVFVCLEGGLAYYTLIAKETGFFDHRPEINILGHSPVAWRGEADRYFLKDLGEVSTAHMEKYCVEMADQLIAATHGLVDWMEAHDWKLPKHVKALPALTPQERRLPANKTLNGVQLPAITELVVLAGHDFRDGLTLFCDVVDALSKQDSGLKKITVIGPFGHILGEHTGGMILRRSRRWNFELNFIPRLEYKQILEYLVVKQAMAIIPSWESATGHWVASCLDHGIPFVATDVGANREYVNKRNAKRCLVERSAKALARNISARLENPKPVSAHKTHAERVQSWDALVEKPSKVVKARKRKAKPDPFVSIIMVHHDRPAYLLQAVNAVENQSYPNFELILVDDGSELPESHRTLDRLEPKFKKKGWKILREENRYLGAARNTGVRASKGSRILFVDDDNALFKDGVRNFVDAMEASGADVCTAFQKVFYEDFIPSSEEAGYIQFIPLGGSLDMGFLHDSFGDANAMIKRSVFDKIGFQYEEYGYTAQDWEFFSRTTLAGLKLRVVPEPVYWYRSSAKGMYRNSHWYDNRLPIIEAFKRHDFKGLEHVYHLVLAQNVIESETRGYRENLLFSAGDKKYLNLCDLDPNSDEAMELMAWIASAEGRPDTAISILGTFQSPEFKDRVHHMLSYGFPEDNRYENLTTEFTTSWQLNTNDLMHMEVGVNREGASVPLSYVEEGGRYFLQAKNSDISLAVLPLHHDRSVKRVSMQVSLEEALTEPAEFLAMLVPSHVDPVLAVNQAADKPGEKATTWVAVRKPFEPKKLDAFFTGRHESSKLVLAVKQQNSASKAVVGCFSDIDLLKDLADRVALRPRRDPPPQHQRAWALTHDMFKKTILLTNHPSELPMLLVGGEGEGVFLRPHKRGPVVACIPHGFHPFARRLSAKVEIAHDEASPFEFALAITRIDEVIDPSAKNLENCFAFSGWHRVSEPFKLHEIELEVSELTNYHMSINLAIRLPRGSSPSPANAFFRSLVLTWDE